MTPKVFVDGFLTCLSGCILHRNSSQQTAQKRHPVEGPQLKAMSSEHTQAINGVVEPSLSLFNQ